jgi:hypothetical protein
MTSIKNFQLFLFKNICKVFDQLKASCDGKKRQKAFQVETGLPTSHSQNLGKLRVLKKLNLVDCILKIFSDSRARTIKLFTAAIYTAML